MGRNLLEPEGRNLLKDKPITSQGRNLLQDKKPEKKDFFKGGSVLGASKQANFGFLNEAALGFPLFALEKFKGKEAVKKLESDVPVERVSRGIGTTVGLVVGAPKLVFKGAGLATKIGIKTLQGTKFLRTGAKILRSGLGAKKAMRTIKFAKAAAEGAAGLAAFELASAPEKNFKEKQVTVPTAALYGAGFGIAGEAVSPAVKRFLTKRKLIQKGRISNTKELKDLNTVLDSAKSQVKEPVTLKTKRFGKFIETELLDRHALIRDLEDGVIQNTGRKIPLKLSPTQQVNRFMGTQGIIQQQIGRYGKELRKAGNNINALEQIKLVQRMRERAARGLSNPGGFNMAKSDKALAELKNSLGVQEFTKLTGIAEQHRRLFRKLLFKSQRAGLLAKDDVKTILEKNQFYTPFEVLDHIGENVNNLAKGKGFRTSIPNAFKALKGTDKNILNPIDAEIRYILKVNSTIEKNAVKQKIFNLRSLDPSLNDIMKPLKSGENVTKGFQKVSFFQDGIKNEFAVEENLANVMNGLNSKTVDMMTKFAGGFSRVLRAGATQFNVGFTLPNLFRDFQQAKLTSKFGFSAVDWVKGLSSTLRKDRFYKQWLANGGGFSGIQQILRTASPTAKKHLAPSISSKALTATNPFNWLGKVSEISETSTRLGVFRRGLRLGVGMEEAISQSRNASIDFAKMGNAMQIANIWVPFLNARVQGTANLFKALKRNPKKFAFTAGTIIGAPAILTHAWNTQNFPDVWDDISEFEKDNNFILITGREKDEKGRWLNVAKIPKGDAGRVIGNPIENFLEYQRGVDPEFSKQAIKMLSDISPIDFERRGELSAGALVSSSLPTVARLPVEIATGKNLFTGRDVVPQRLQKASPEEQFEIDTPPMAIALGKLIGVSPLEIKNAAGTLFAGLGRQLIDPLKAHEVIRNTFSGAYGGAEQNKQFEILGDIELDTDDKNAKSTRLSQESWEQWQSIPPVPELRKQFIKRIFKDDEKALEKFIDIVESNGSGEMPIHRALKRASVRDRLKFINQYTETLENDEDRILFLQDIIQNKVITENSLKGLK